MSTDALIGQTVDGKYRIVERIGRGGMGTVYRATDDTLNRDVAIKVLNAGLQEPEIAARFRAEAMTVARLNHPGIAMVYELFEHGGQWLMVMEFVPGETLEALIDRTGPMSPERAAEVCLYALSALAHAHNLGIVHRDLKPANLMLAENGIIKVMDFGIARVSGTDHLTSAGYMMGTPAYMAPEQVLGGDIDARADLYAMGVVFYRLVTGKLPFTGETPFAVAQSHVNDAPTPIGTLRAGLPPWVDQMVSRALAKRPEERFQSAAAFHDVLSRCLADRSATATYDPSAATELMVTPPFALPTGSIRPPVDTARTLIEPAKLTGANPPGSGAVVRPSGSPSAAIASSAAGASTAMAPGSESPRANRGILIAVAVIMLTGIAFVIWSTRAPVPPAGTPPGADASQPPAPAPSGTALTDNSRGGNRAGAPGAASADGRKTGAPAAAAGTATPGTGTAAPGTAALGTAATGAVPSATDPLVFSDVKLLTVTGKKAKDQDVVLSLLADRIWVNAKAGGPPLQSVLFKNVMRGTYIKAKIPKFDAAFPAPPADLDMPGLIVTSKHWLALQTRDVFLILRLDDSNYASVLDNVQTRARIKIVKP